MSTHLSKPIGHATQRVNTNVNCELQRVMMGQCRFTYCNKCSTVVQDFERGGLLVYGEKGNMEIFCSFYTILL